MATPPSSVVATAIPAVVVVDPTKETKTPASFARRDHLISIEKKAQADWAARRVFETDAPAAGSPEAKNGKYFATFPYPYMNGVLHLGHAFTISKAEFATRFQALLGKNVLFPFGFHCTGMPIAACADKLKREIQQFGNPPVFPAAVEEPVVAAAAPAKGAAAKKGTAAAAAASPNDEDDEEEEVEEVVEVKGDEKKVKTIKKKGKLAGKKGRQTYQWEIMRDMGVPLDQIPKFQDARHWLQYFPPIAMDHLKEFGLCSDFRRSFITTDVNPYYDSFVRWQFKILKAKSKVTFGPRNTIYSPIDDQPCADHDRATGEGVGPQEYTLIKIRVLDVPARIAAFTGSAAVYLPAATLRPETMYGQTNVFLLPEGVYGIYRMKDGEVFICSTRSALNMSYQGFFSERGKPTLLGECKGQELMGCAVKAPLSFYPKVFVLPLLTIKMNKGTGVVTSVPSDAPDDYAALMDLKNKAALREKFGIKEEHVLPFDPVPIIDVEGLGTLSAVDLCIKYKVKSQNDAATLEMIKGTVYLDAFYKGRMIVGEHKGAKVSDAKPLIKALLVSKNEATTYSEPESVVMSRSGNECVVALTDQWYLVYGEDTWKAQVEGHIKNTLECYNPASLKRFSETVAWLHEWACSRTYGLGTKLPWDEKWVIESLSDSTIYMAYYTVAHFLQSSLEGDKKGSGNIAPDQMTDDVWNYIFLAAPMPKTKIAVDTLKKMRNEFEFWYPMDMRASGKDLIGNHLTMSLYNHAAIWDKDESKWPRSFWTNGHLLINSEKMSKSTGNFMTLDDAIKKWGADAVRATLADAGDSLEDANFVGDTANKIILRLTKEEAWVEEQIKAIAAGELRTGPASSYNFFDRVFENEMNEFIAAGKEAFEKMQFRNAFKSCFYDFTSSRDAYRASIQVPLHRDLVVRWIEAFTVMMSPITPHLSQHLWVMLGKKGDAAKQRWPLAGEVNGMIQRQIGYLRDTAASFRLALLRQKEKVAKQAAKAKAKGAAPAATAADASAPVVVAAADPKKAGKQAKGGAPKADGGAAVAAAPATAANGDAKAAEPKKGKGGKGAAPTAAAPSTGETKVGVAAVASSDARGSVGTSIVIPVTQPWLRIGFEASDLDKSPSDATFIAHIRTEYAVLLAREGRVVAASSINVTPISPEPIRAFNTVRDFIMIGGIYNVNVKDDASSTSTPVPPSGYLTAAELDFKLAAFKAEILAAIQTARR